LSGETQNNISAWTIDSLKEHLETVFDERNERYQQRFDDQTKAIDAALTAQQTAVIAALAAVKEANDLSRISNDRRLELLNESRRTIDDQSKVSDARFANQSATFITRNEAEASTMRLTERLQETLVRLQAMATHTEVTASAQGLDTRIQEMQRRIENFVPRDVVLAEYNLMSKAVTDLGDRVTRSEGRDSGTHAGWGYLFAAITAIAALVTIYIALRH
jgi:hypothetical protein